ncbi:hypothetical protein DPMN_038746 [Dreissena polymorpha]|uniref:Uncharacterized protein n=1 Tax=Dreissena polymorpha TaxID=45954 RepID=A0A9D4MDQ0_DREPO|nr:hypothetical protein DPMN_038746 [Dreissena polymorpha]
MTLYAHALNLLFHRARLIFQQQRPTYSEDMLVVLNLGPDGKWLVSEVSHTAAQLLVDTVTVNTEQILGLQSKHWS